MSDYKKIIKSWQSKSVKPVYWIEGEEDYYIDLLAEYAEKQLLAPQEAEFNLTVFYGRDADPYAIINACRRYPMFAEKQVVLLKEAQLMKDIDKLTPYIESPLASTIFIVDYKGKLDKRTKLSMILKTAAEVFTSAKIQDYKLPEWIAGMVQEKGFEIKPKGIALLADQIGSNLSRLANEIDKLSINLEGKKNIDEDDIEKYIGISKEYNAFELGDAILTRDLAKAIRIIHYFESNPKANPIQMILPALYSNLSKLYVAAYMADKSDAALRPLFYYNLKQAKFALQSYGVDGIEKMLLLLHQYNLKSIGIGDSGTSDASLLREMAVKMIMD